LSPACERLVEPEAFHAFTYERQFVVVDRLGTIERLSLERLAADTYQLRFTLIFARANSEPCTSGDCYRRSESEPRLLTAAELDGVRGAFADVRWEREADTETCPLWDPAYVDTFTWDGFTLTTNLCNAPHLPFGQAESLRQVLYGLTGPA